MNENMHLYNEYDYFTEGRISDWFKSIINWVKGVFNRKFKIPPDINVVSYTPESLTELLKRFEFDAKLILKDIVKDPETRRRLFKNVEIKGNLSTVEDYEKILESRDYTGKEFRDVYDQIQELATKFEDILDDVKTHLDSKTAAEDKKQPKSIFPLVTFVSKKLTASIRSLLRNVDNQGKGTKQERTEFYESMSNEQFSYFIENSWDPDVDCEGLLLTEEFREEHKAKNPKPTPEYNTDMTEAQAKQTLGTLSANLMESTKRKSYKVTQYTANIYSNIITKNLLPIWAPKFKNFKIILGDYKTYPIVEFKVPAMTLDFVARFVNGRETIQGHLGRSNEIIVKMSPRVFTTMENRNDAYNFFKAMIKYYSGPEINRAATQMTHTVMNFGHNMRHLIGHSRLSALVTYPLQLLFSFDDVKMSNTSTFKIDKSDIQTINRFMKNIAVKYAAPEKEKNKIVDDLKELVKTFKENTSIMDDWPLRGHHCRCILILHETVAEFYAGKFDYLIKQANEEFVESCIDREYKPMQEAKMMYEKWGVKRLKKIPRDLIAYITIETESIQDSNDKMMISSYCLGKLEIVEWYIELLEVGSKKYIVPHNLPYLQSMRTSLLACFKKIMDVKIKNPRDRPLIDIKYPTGYEG